MKTTVEIPDHLFRKAKATAALRGIPLKDLIVTGLELALEQNSSAEPFCQTFPLIQGSNDGRVLSSEDVRQALELADAEEAQDIAASLRR